MTAETIAKALGGRRCGTGWQVRCPSHKDSRPSLSIKDSERGVLVFCHARCSQHAVITALKSLGLWPRTARLSHNESRQRFTNSGSEPTGNERTALALKIWSESKPSMGTLVETYLASRGIKLGDDPTLRFHPYLSHPSGDSWPAMIALVTRGSDDAPLAIHRTFLARSGAGKAAVEPQKMMLGPCRGGAVRLAEPGDLLLIGEGIETSLAAMQETGYPAWAALSTSGLRALDLPSDVRDVIVLADGDDPGEAAARDCALRWKREGRRVRIARPPRGLDFNDMLVRGVSPVAEGAR